MIEVLFNRRQEPFPRGKRAHVTHLSRLVHVVPTMFSIKSLTTIRGIIPARTRATAAIITARVGLNERKE
jgi:hypothetical protein